MYNGNMNNDYNPTDLEEQDKQRRDKELRAKLARETEEEDIKWLMSSKRGRRIVWRLLAQAGVFRPSFTTNAMQTAFNEGNRNYGLKILTLVHDYSADQYPQMMKENTDNGRNSNVRTGHNNQ